jgi:uncharacterized membrane protein YgdD (TMEM256/DUF423 family)
MKKITIIAAVFGFMGVAMGAFGAHALRDSLAAAGMTQTWQTAVQYNLIHAVICFLLTRNAADTDVEIKRAGLGWVFGMLLFSGSLYGLALGGPRILGPITPIGGICLLYGWAYAAWGSWKSTTVRS